MKGITVLTSSPDSPYSFPFLLFALAPPGDIFDWGINALPRPSAGEFCTISALTARRGRTIEDSSSDSSSSSSSAGLVQLAAFYLRQTELMDLRARTYRTCYFHFDV
jgi:hypothetical protein